MPFLPAVRHIKTSPGTVTDQRGGPARRKAYDIGAYEHVPFRGGEGWHLSLLPRYPYVDPSHAPYFQEAGKRFAQKKCPTHRGSGVF